MSNASSAANVELKATILEILNENRIMSVATCRSDGWPQVTMVGFVHDDLTLYFSIARDSQKYANIAREPRVSIAIGHDQPDHIRGLSMAARVAEVTDLDEIRRLNTLIQTRYSHYAVFAPREAASAVMRAEPEVISMIDMSKGPGRPTLLQVSSETSVHLREGEPPPGMA